MSFADKVRDSRKNLGISQERLADDLNVSRQSVAKWESEIGYPETRMLLLLAGRLGVSLDYLFDDEIEGMKKRLKEDQCNRDEENVGEADEARRYQIGLVDEVVKDFTEGYKPNHITTGFSILDKKLIGELRFGLYVLSGHQSSGKTSLMLNITKNVLEQQGCVIYYTMNESAKDLTRRLLGIIAEVETGRPKECPAIDKQRIHEAGQLMENSMLIIENAYDASVESIIGKSVRKAPNMIVIDSNGKLFSENKGRTKVQIYKDLRGLAYMCKCPVFVLERIDKKTEEILKENPVSTNIMRNIVNRKYGIMPEELLLLSRKDFYRFPTKYDNTITIARLSSSGDGVVR